MPAIALLLALLLDACSAPYRGPPLPAPPRDAPTIPAAASPAAASTPVELDLAGVIRACLLGDPRLRAALAQVEQARADFTTASLAPNPVLAISDTLIPLPGTPGSSQFDIGLAYSLDALVFGKRSAAMEAARLGVDEALADQAELTRRRILEAVSAYYDVLEASELLRLSRDEVVQLERLVEITDRRARLGSAGDIEVDRIRLAAINGRRRVVKAEAELDNARSRLRAQLGPAPGGARVEVVGTLEIGSPPEAPDLARVLRLAEAHRPDLLALGRRTARARAELVRERRAARPTLDVALGYTAVGFPDASFWGVGLELSLPILDRNQGNIAHAESAVRQAEQLAVAAQLELRADVEQALRSYRAAREIATALDEQALAAAVSARQRTEEAYALGGRTLVEVLDAQTAYREVLRDHATARAELLRALHRMSSAAGTEVVRWPTNP